MKENLRSIDNHGHAFLAMISLRAVDPYGIGIIHRHGEDLFLQIQARVSEGRCEFVT